jgi:anti-sigma factor RsiW
MSGHAPDLRKLFAMVDGRLSPTDKLALRTHLEACKPCTDKLGELERTRAALREMGTRMPVPPDRDPNAEAKLMQAVEQRGAPGLRVAWWWLPATAGATLLLALLVLPTLRSASSGEPPVTAQVDRTGPAAAGGAAATVLAVRGQVENGPSLEALHAGTAGEELAPAAVVRTGADGEIRLALAAGGELTLGASSTLFLPEDPDGIVRLESGAVDVAVVPRAEGQSPFGVETPLARIEAIGTKFRVTHEAAFTAVDVREGKVRFVSLRSDEERLVLAGKSARADGEGRLADGPGEPVDVAVGPQPGEPTEAPMEFPAPGVDDPGTGDIATAEPVQVRRANGTIDQGKVRARVSRQRGALQACYSDYVMRMSPQAVEARVRFVVLENGTPGEIELNLSVADQPLQECIERVFRAIEFPRPQGGPARVFYPVRFSL